MSQRLLQRHQIEYHTFPRHETCTYETCRSRKYYLEDGQRFCKAQGHRQEGYVQEASDEDDFGLAKQGRTTRRRVTRETRKSLVLGGREALVVWVEGLQIVLRSMVAGLGRCLNEQRMRRHDCNRNAGDNVDDIVRINENGESEQSNVLDSSDCQQGGDSAHPELEAVVRNLWALRLRAIRGLDESNLASQSGYTSENGGFSSQGNSSAEDTGAESDSVISNMSSAGRIRRKRKTMGRTYEGVPEVKDLLGICYLGCLLLRLPISLGEMYQWIKTEEIVYVRAIRIMPKDMIQALPTYYTQALEPQPLRVDDLHKVVIELTISFKQRFECILPPLNAPLLLYKHIRTLRLPIDIYMSARRLGKTLGLKYEYPFTISRISVASWPELQVIGMIVIATKLSQNLDGIDRVPDGIIHPSALTIDWDVWASSLVDPEVNGLEKGTEMDLTWKDVERMDDKKLDDYLDWYGKTWTDIHELKMPSQILDMFPVKSSEQTGKPSRSITTKDEMLKENLRYVQSELKHHSSRSMEEDHDPYSSSRPGTFYSIYKNITDLEESKTTKLFYQKAAESAGISLDTLVRGVAMLEKQLQNYVTLKKKQKRLAEWETQDEELENAETAASQSE